MGLAFLVLLPVLPSYTAFLPPLIPTVIVGPCERTENKITVVKGEIHFGLLKGWCTSFVLMVFLKRKLLEGISHI
jgi:hypothetical protein